MRIVSPQGRKKLLEHNHRFTKGNHLLPHANEEALYGSLACSHLSVALRCIQAGLPSPWPGRDWSCSGTGLGLGMKVILISKQSEQ